MPRPKKCRRICGFPRQTEFFSAAGALPPVELAVDEYEVLRLLDYEGLRQEEAAAQMGVARTTVQSIYAAARRKLAQCLVEGRSLRIAGGNVEVCGDRETCGGGRRCCVRCCRRGGDGTAERLCPETGGPVPPSKSEE